jgi:hypothetical protein
MNKTIYLRDDEVPVWERARELADDKLSPVIVAALRRFIADREAEAKGYGRIVLSFDDAGDHNLPKGKAFYGKWVLPMEDPYQFPTRPGSDDLTTNHCAVAVSAKGAAVFYRWSEDPAGEGYGYQFDHFESLEHAAKQRGFNAPACAAIEKLGVPVEELDI